MGDLSLVKDSMSVDDVRQQVNLIQNLLSQTMKKDTHYGVIPGCGDKPTLLKAGAEKLALTFRLDLDSEVEVVDMDNGHREYRVKTTASSINSGLRMGSGSGACTTMESKWRFRAEATGEEVPKDYWETRDPNIIGGSQFSTRKMAGKWMIMHKVEHDNPADYYNTCLKMAEKRSKVACVLNVTAASDIFTQDIEDMPEFTENRTEPKPEVKKTQSKSSQQEAETSDGGEIITKIAEVKQKKSPSSAKKAWTQYIVHSTGGTQYKTFDKKIAETAAEACETDQECLIIFEYNEKFKSNEIQVIDIMKDDDQDDNVNPTEDDYADDNA
jgi:hypothetical protein|tara:strand:+ start:226 stop:1206 length:981 start_codon:yes stop_codon:yes gene_type:complete